MEVLECLLHDVLSENVENYWILERADTHACLTFNFLVLILSMQYLKFEVRGWSQFDCRSRHSVRNIFFCARSSLEAVSCLGSDFVSQFTIIAFFDLYWFQCPVQLVVRLEWIPGHTLADMDGKDVFFRSRSDDNFSQNLVEIPICIITIIKRWHIDVHKGNILPDWQKSWKPATELSTAIIVLLRYEA